LLKAFQNCKAFANMLPHAVGQIIDRVFAIDGFGSIHQLISGYSMVL